MTYETCDLCIIPDVDNENKLHVVFGDIRLCPKHYELIEAWFKVAVLTFKSTTGK